MSTNNYKLLIQKNVENANFQHIVTINFSIVDVNLPAYPRNFVCIFPKCKQNLFLEGNFVETFKDIDRASFAINLLNDALQNPEYSNDIDIKNDIEKRLKLLCGKTKEPKKCKKCGEAFVHKSYRVKFCSSCREKYYANHKFEKANYEAPNYRKNNNSLPKPKIFPISKSVVEAFNNGAFEQ